MKTRPLPPDIARAERKAGECARRAIRISAHALTSRQMRRHKHHFSASVDWWIKSVSAQIKRRPRTA